MAGEPERPIKEFDQDELSREGFVDRLCKALIDETTTKSKGIVVGVTGPWGSGKTSLLNLLHKRIEQKYADVVVVRFDPWLVSGRNDLISAFISELIASIKSNPSVKTKLRGFVKSVAKYGAHVSPLADVWAPGSSAVIKGGLKAVETALTRDDSIHAQRERLVAELKKVSVPIVAFIDELDRIEDAEVRTVAQLVRSVADFPGISYVLAYDVERVVQALGGGSEPEQVARGRGYLEKIVQLQIPLPITLAEEIRQLLRAELQSIAGDIRLPENWSSIPRYGELVDKIVPEVVTTPRDIKRLVGTYHALASMLENEVDWIDLLAFSALMVKAPGTIENIRRTPEDVVNNPLSTGTSMRRFIENREKKDRVKDVIASGEGDAAIEELLIHLFPALKRDSHRRQDQSADSLCMRRPLLTTLRLGLLPGGYSRSNIQGVFDKSESEIEGYLQQLFRDDAIAAFLDRLSEVYPTLDDVDDASFWRAVDRFVEKPDCEWITCYSQMHAVTRELSDIFGSRVSRSNSFDGGKIFRQLLAGERIALASNLLRSQIFAHGLFGNEKRDSTRTVFLTAEDTERTSLELSSKFKERHLHGQFISCLWSLVPVYTMRDNKTWDEDCKAQARRQIDDPAALDAWAILLFGAHYYTERSTVESLIGFEDYVNAAKARSESQSVQDAHETVRLALAKAFRGSW